jgi:CRISPR-associated endonuclease/helicase Cas3
MIVTTFVQLFHTLIGYKNRFLKKFHNIVNSIVILDEVQNINPDYYKLIQNTFKILGERFGIYFLLITATQPEILENDTVIKLIDSNKYMTSDIFNRVKLYTETKEMKIEDFAKKFCYTFSDENCLLVMNTKSYAKKLYEIINENYSDYEIYCLTTNLTPYDRKIQIAEIQKYLKNNNKIIVISTQLIEAGVDLSFKNVYRDLGPLDSIIQVAGRCNRHNEFGKVGGEMHLINLNNFNIYKRILSQYINEIVTDIKYESKDFYHLSKTYFHKFNFISESKKLLNSIKELNYDTLVEGQTPISKFTLIDDAAKYNIFILRTKNAQNDMKNLISLKRMFKKKLSKDEKDKIRLKIENCKHKLLEFQIAVYENELNAYKDLIEPQEELLENKEFPYRYISFQYQKDYVYDEKIGFLSEPKKIIKSTIVL